MFKMGYEARYMFVINSFKVFFEKWIFDFFKANIINFALKKSKKIVFIKFFNMMNNKHITYLIYHFEHYWVIFA